jgi:hypothetical protein
VILNGDHIPATSSARLLEVQYPQLSLEVARCKVEELPWPVSLWKVLRNSTGRSCQGMICVVLVNKAEAQQALLESQRSESVTMIMMLIPAVLTKFNLEYFCELSAVVAPPATRMCWDLHASNNRAQ